MMETLVLTRGDDRAVQVRLQDEGSALKGYEATLTIRASVNDPHPILISKSVVGSYGLIEFVFTQQQTYGLPIGGSFTSDVQITYPDGRIQTMTPDGNELFDPAIRTTVFPDITRPGDEVQ
jgi:hypothetical protein